MAIPTTSTFTPNLTTPTGVDPVDHYTDEAPECAGGCGGVATVGPWCEGGCEGD